MQLLPSELKYIIAKLLSSAPKSLAALARTHTAFQTEAEMALYETIYIYAEFDDSLECVGTLATNSEKAALVRSLTIEYISKNSKKTQRVTADLLKSLVNMHSLSDFRIKSVRNGVESESITRLGEILW
jgi:hypothetical protein